jgi:hypothetical protein
MEFVSFQSDKKRIHKIRRRIEGTVLSPTVHAHMCKEELSLCLIKHHTKREKRRSAGTASHILHMSSQLHSWGKGPQYPLAMVGEWDPKAGPDTHTPTTPRS